MTTFRLINKKGLVAAMETASAIDQEPELSNLYVDSKKEIPVEISESIDNITKFDQTQSEREKEYLALKAMNIIESSLKKP